MKKYFAMLKETFQEWKEDDAPQLAAALSYYTIFSLGPLMLIVVSVAGLVFGDAAAQDQVFQQVRSVMGENAAEAIRSMMEGRSQGNAGLWGTIIGIVLLLISASGVFGQLQKALNEVWEVAPRPDLGIWGTVKARFLSMTMVLGLGFLLLVSLLLSTALSSLQEFMQGQFPGSQLLWQLAGFAVSLAVMVGLFAAIFKVLPDAEIKWSDVWVGAATTAVLFEAGKWLISLYLANSSMVSNFGAGGSLVVVLVWVYFSSMLLFFGAEFTQVYARRKGRSIRPSEHAVRVVQEKRQVAS